MNDPDVFSEPCAICHIRKATRYCDYIVGYSNYPIFFRDYTKFKEANEGTRYETCDLPLCEKCSHEINRVDFCPHHYKLYQQAKLPNHLKKAQSRSKMKAAQELLMGK